MNKIAPPDLFVRLTVLLVALSFPFSVLAQEEAPTESTFQEDARVTAVDVMVQLDSPGKKGDIQKALEGWPPRLEPDDFRIVYDGEERPVISVEVPAYPGDGEPWTVVLYFDLTLTSPFEIGWAASELMAEAARLTALGNVEVIVADPVPHRTLAPTRDTETLQAVLSEMALFPEGDEHEVLAVRDEFLTEIAEPTTEMSNEELAPLVADYEARLIRSQLDRLQTFLADLPASPKKALFLVNGGFDLRLEEFYQPHVTAELASADLEAATQDFENALASYGWITFAMIPPPEPPPLTGLRLGKWLFAARPQASAVEQTDPTNPHKSRVINLFSLLSAKREDQREPDRADSYVELGRSLREGGDGEEAEHAYRLAIYHYAQDPRTADRQATAWNELGETLQDLGRRREARDAFLQARKLDPSSEVVELGPIAELLDPLAPGLSLCKATTGTMIRHSSSLVTALGELGQRVRLTFQVSGEPDGELHSLEVRSKRKYEPVATAWIRSGVPQEVAAARVRRMLGDEDIEGDLVVQATLKPLGDGRFRLEGSVRGGEENLESTRMTIGVGTPEELAALEHRTVKPFQQEEEGQNGVSEWSFVTDLAPPAGPYTVAVLVEDMISGLWGTAAVDLPEDSW